MASSPWAAADFDELDGFVERTNGDAVLIVERGITVHEWYRTDADDLRDVASVQKSVLSLLVGRAIADGLIQLETRVDDVLGDGWTAHGQTSTITVRHLLTMTSGLDDSLAVTAEPGTEWRYSGAFAQLFAVVSTVTGRPIDDVAREWLFEPAGARSARFYDRPASTAFAPIGLLASAADLAAIGQLVLDGDVPSVPPAWLDESFTTSQPFNASYGYLWWLNGRGSYVLPGRDLTVRSGDLIPPAPDDVVAALGKDDQKLYIASQLDLVVVRLGERTDPQSALALSSFDADLWSLLTRLRG